LVEAASRKRDDSVVFFSGDAREAAPGGRFLGIQASNDKSSMHGWLMVWNIWILDDDFPFSWEWKIIPTVTHSIMFQRGRLKPPTRWL